MFYTTRRFLSGKFDRVNTLRFFWKAGLFPAVESLFKVVVHKRVRLTLGNNVKVEGPGCVQIGHDTGHFPRGTISSFRMAEGARLVLKGKHLILSGHQISIEPGATLELDSGYINHDAKIGCSHHIRIGKDTIISEDAIIMDSDAHELAGSESAWGIDIGERVWIGIRVTILKNVRIGDGCVIAAGSVVTKDIPSGCLAGGVPAKVIRENVRWAL